MEATRNTPDTHTLPLFPFEFDTQEEAAQFKHDWEHDDDWFGAQDARYSLCNVLMLDLSDIQYKFRRAHLDNCGRLMEVFALAAGWCHVTNGVYELAKYDYQELAGRLEMSESSMRREFKWGVKKGLWDYGEGVAGVRLLDDFLALADVKQAASEIRRSRGKKKSVSEDMFPASSVGITLNPKSQNPASCAQLHDLYSVGSRELVLEASESSSEIAPEFAQEVSDTIEDESKAHGFAGRINPKLLVRAAEAIWSEGCRKASQARRYIKVLIGALAQRGDTSHYRAHTIAGIVRDDADKWMMLLKQTPASRAQAYVDAQSSTTRLELDYDDPIEPQTSPKSIPPNPDGETFEGLVKIHESERLKHSEISTMTRHKAEQDVFTDRERLDLPDEAERSRVAAMISELTSAGKTHPDSSASTSDATESTLRPRLSPEEMKSRERIELMLKNLRDSLDEALVPSSKSGEVTRPHLRMSSA